MRRFIAIADGFSVALAVALAVVLLCRLAICVPRLDPLAVLLGLTLGFFVADVASGLVHWLCDTYFDPRTPLLGTVFIAPFREHHVDPGALARHGFLERNGNNCLVSVPLLLIGISRLEPDAVTQPADVVAAGLFVAASLTLCVTNQIHAWAHAANTPKPIRVLQRAGILITPERHARHHRGDRAYAVVSGWSNALLDRVLARTEVLLAAFGAKPSGSGAQA
jgi:ubiquitin-conjugating enzyme E2 variant